MLTITISKRSALLIAVALLLVIPAAAFAGVAFTDVEPSSVHAPGIGWVADAGVTAGCGDGTTYCPDDPVTRAQMGTFMHRLSGNAPGIDPSVNAAELDGNSASDFLMAADAANFVAGSDLQVFTTSIPFGGSEVLASAGPLSVFANCTLDNAGNDELEVFLESSVGGSLYIGTPLTANVPTTIAGPFTIATGDPLHFTNSSPNFGALAADGTSLTNLIWLSYAINAGGHDCLVQGAVVAG